MPATDSASCAVTAAIRVRTSENAAWAGGRLCRRAASRSDEDKIGVGLAKLHEEDPTFHSGYDGDVKQTIIRGLGELHLDVQMERLKRKYHVEVTTEEPRPLTPACESAAPAQAVAAGALERSGLACRHAGACLPWCSKIAATSSLR